MMMKIKVQDQNQEEEIREAFKVFDNVSYYFVYFRSDLCYMLQDGNGYIDRRELALMMRFSGEVVTDGEIEVKDDNDDETVYKSHMQEIINEADMDRNGLIDYTEFFTMMTPKRS